MRRAAKVDGNHAEIVAALEKVGATVQSLAQIGRGCPDVLCAYGGDLFLLEFKSAKGKTNKAQDDWHAAWKSTVYVVRTAQEALVAIGAML